VCASQPCHHYHQRPPAPGDTTRYQSRALPSVSEVLPLISALCRRTARCLGVGVGKGVCVGVEMGLLCEGVGVDVYAGICSM